MGAMNALLRAIGLIAVLTALFAGEVRAAEIVVIPIKGQISQAQFFFLRRALKTAERDGARAVILNMDTYGGELNACRQMQEALSKVKVRTLTYVNPNAGSAGALIALATKDIYMAPISAIGAAAPVMAGGEDLSATLKDKQVSFLSSYYASVAAQNGHNPDIAEAFINKGKAVVIGGQTIHEKGSVLTLSAQEAAKVIDGKPVLAAGIASSLEDLVKQAKLEGVIHTVEPTGFEVLAFWVTLLAPLFLLGGILGAYIEIKVPGFGLPGILSAVCFAIFFAGHYVAGLAGWEAPVLFIVGLAFILSELFIHPGTVFPGLIGAVFVVTAVVWAMIDRYPGAPLIPDAELLLWPLLKLTLAVVLAIVGCYFLAQYLPQSSVFGGLVLASSQPQGAALSATKSEFTRLAVGAEGVAHSILRPSGKAEFDGRLYDVITPGQFVDPGTPLRVVDVEGMRIVVEPKEV